MHSTEEWQWREILLDFWCCPADFFLSVCPFRGLLRIRVSKA
jgi:hypothetical protein